MNKSALLCFGYPAGFSFTPTMFPTHSKKGANSDYRWSDVSCRVKTPICGRGCHWWAAIEGLSNQEYLKTGCQPGGRAVCYRAEV